MIRLRQTQWAFNTLEQHVLENPMQSSCTRDCRLQPRDWLVIAHTSAGVMHVCRNRRRCVEQQATCQLTERQDDAASLLHEA